VLWFRALRAIALAPAAEELFWRAWLIRWLVQDKFLELPLGAYSPLSFWLVALLFGIEHGPQWHVQLVDGAHQELGRSDSGSCDDQCLPQRLRAGYRKMGILAVTSTSTISSTIERVRPEAAKSCPVAPRARAVLFDFDGTLSLIRSGWMDVMVPMMVETLLELKTGESEAALRAIVEDFVWRLTGKETIYQMMEFAEHVARRGGNALDAREYKKIYLDRLWLRIRGRVEDLRHGRCPAEQYLVPGARELLQRLKNLGLRMYLASGTDEVYMREEARLLDIARYFDGGVYGALDDYKSFSKKILIQRILSQTDVQGEEILVFGDGYVEIEEVKLVGGAAVGVATREPECRQVDEWKRQRLIGVGADYIVPNFLCCEELLGLLFGS
jgi:phosphoglycolate phosphatase-like HAD superfamily hydrolase